MPQLTDGNPVGYPSAHVPFSIGITEMLCPLGNYHNKVGHKSPRVCVLCTRLLTTSVLVKLALQLQRRRLY